MTRLVSAIVLMLSLVGGPVVLDRCLVSCTAAGRASSMPACHHVAAPAHHDWSAATRCGHDHRPWSAIAADQANACVAALVALAVPGDTVEDVPAGPAAPSASPPVSTAPPAFVRPLRV